MDKKPVRVFFEKKGKAYYISHLDLLRTMQRALKRSGLPVWYSEGFNPRIYLNFPLALSLGVEGCREAMDFYITAETSYENIITYMNSEMPDGLRVLSAAAPVHLNKDIGFAEYSAIYEGNDIGSAAEEFMSLEKIEVLKHSKKKGMITVDIKPSVKINGITDKDGLTELSFTLPAGQELNLNAGIFTGAFASFCEQSNKNAELICTKRTNILCSDGSVFE